MKNKVLVLTVILLFTCLVGFVTAQGLLMPEGAKCLGQWSTTEGGRAFTLFEVNDNMAAAQWAASFNDLGKFETYTVVDTEELIKAITAK